MKKLSVLFYAFAITLPIHAYGAHSECSDYCGADLACHNAIEAQHNYLDGCSNYGYQGYPVGVTELGEHCKNTIGVRSLTVNTMDCEQGDSCRIHGVLICPGGNQSIDITCWPGGGSLKVEATRQQVTCERGDGTGYNISCGGDGVLESVW